MNRTQQVRVLPKEEQDDRPQSPAADSCLVRSSVSPVRRAIHRTRHWLLGQQHDDGHWCAELEGDTILESETILLLAFLGHEDSDLARRCAAVSGREATARRRLGHVSRRRRRDQRQREGLFRPEADRPRPERRVHAAGPRGDPCPRRGRRGQQLHPLLPGPAGPDSLRAVSRRCRRRSCCCPSGSRSTSTRSAPGRGRSSCRLSIISAHAAGAAARAAAGHPRVVPPGAGGLAAAAVSGLAGRHRPVELGPLLPHGRSAASSGASATGVCRCGARPWPRPSVDARPLRAERRPGRDLSADRLEHRGAEVPGLSPTTAPRCSTATSSCETWCWTTKTTTRAGSSRASRRSGTRPSRSGPWRPAACGRSDPAIARGGRLAAGPADSPAAAIGPRRSTPSRAAGASSTPTISIPTATTRRWC